MKSVSYVAQPVFLTSSGTRISSVIFSKLQSHRHNGMNKFIGNACETKCISFREVHKGPDAWKPADFVLLLKGKKIEDSPAAPFLGFQGWGKMAQLAMAAASSSELLHPCHSPNRIITNHWRDDRSSQWWALKIPFIIVLSHLENHGLFKKQYTSVRKF